MSLRKPSTLDLALSLVDLPTLTEAQVGDLYGRMTTADRYFPGRLEGRAFNRGEVSALLSAGVFLNDSQRAAALRPTLERMLGRLSPWDLMNSGDPSIM